jgi:hypothetical protein
LKRFQPIISAARAHDINESDTVTIVADLLAGLFGYDKYNEITSQHAIRGTYCDLAIKTDGQLRFLVEVKQVETDFRDTHIKQAVDYAAKQGVDWVILTNGWLWRVYRMAFAKPVDWELVVEFDLLNMNPRSSADVERLALLSREGITRSMLEDYHAHRQATNRFLLGALVLSEPVVHLIRRELRKLTPDVKVSPDDVRRALSTEVLKREVVDGEDAAAAQKRIARLVGKASSPRRQRASKANREQIDAGGDRPADQPISAPTQTFGRSY